MSGQKNTGKGIQAMLHQLWRGAISGSAASNGLIGSFNSSGLGFIESGNLDVRSVVLPSKLRSA